MCVLPRALNKEWDKGMSGLDLSLEEEVEIPEIPDKRRKWD